MCVEITTSTTYQPSGVICRVDQKSTKIGEINSTPIFAVEYGSVEGLPEPKEDIIYLVSSLVLAALKGTRTDVYAPGDLIRDEKGQPIGCKGFKVG